MPPATASAPAEGTAGRWPAPRGEELLSGYLAALAARGAGNRSFVGAAHAFLSRWPDPQRWAEQPLPVRLSAGSSVRPLLNYLMLAGSLRPGYDYLLERKLAAILRESQTSPLAGDVSRFLLAATELGYTTRVAAGLASQIAVRLMIQTGRPLRELDDTDFAEFDSAITAREQVHARPLKHYRTALNATRTVLHHMDGQVNAAVRNSAHLRWPWRRHFTGVPTAVADSLVAYLECASGTRTRSTVLGLAGRLGHFARFLAEHDPALSSLAALDRQRHIEPYLAAVAATRNPRTGVVLSASERRSRVLTVGRLIDDINEWGWAEAPGRKLVFARDVPPTAQGAAPLPAAGRRPAALGRAARLTEPAARRRAAAATRHRHAHRRATRPGTGLRA
jgi:hypothetical protein